MMYLNSSCTTIFYSATINICVRSLILGSLYFIVSIVKIVSKELVDCNVSREAKVEVMVVSLDVWTRVT